MPSIAASSQLVEHRRVALGPGRVRVVDAGDLDLRHAQVEHRRLAHAALAERRQDVADVVEERPVGPDHEHAVAGQAAAVLEQQVRGAVQGDGRLAGARAALHDEHLVHRRPDDEVLLGLDRGDDLAHRAGALGADLGEHRVGDAAGDVGGVGVVEVLVEVRGDLALVEHEAPAQVDAERVGAGGAVERRGDRRPPVDDDRVVARRPRCGGGRCTSARRRRPVAGVDAPEEVAGAGRVQVLQRLLDRDLDVLGREARRPRSAGRPARAARSSGPGTRANASRSRSSASSGKGSAPDTGGSDATGPVAPSGF